MKKTVKMLMTILIVAATVFTVAADGPVLKAAPGAMMFVYNLTDGKRPAPDADCIDVVADNSPSFMKNNLRKYKETDKFADQKIFIVWKGFIRVDEAGTYTISLSFGGSGNGNANHVVFQLNGRDLLTISHFRDSYVMNDSCSVQMEKGDYEVTVIYRAIYDGDFSLRMWNKNTPLKKIEITPENMLHAE